ncbi:hypothetical protein [Polymorphobacter megasporae]
MIEVLAAVASCERDATRLATLRRHADLVVDDAKRTIGSSADLTELLSRQANSQLDDATMVGRQFQTEPVERAPVIIMSGISNDVSF